MTPAAGPTSHELLSQEIGALMGSLGPASVAALAQEFAVAYLGGASADSVPLGQAVDEVLGIQPRERRAAIVRGLKLVELKNLITRAIWKHGGLLPISEIVRCAQPEKLQKFHRQRLPAIVTFSHVGARFAVGPALHKLGVPALVIARGIPAFLSAEHMRTFVDSLPGLSYLEVPTLQEQGAAVFLRAVAHLRQGRLVCIAIDGRQGDAELQTTFLGRQITVKRGIGALARLTGAPIIPVVMPYAAAGWNIDLHIGDPLMATAARTEPEQYERSLIEQALRWFEAYVRQHPEQLRLDRLAHLRAAPRVPQIH